MFKYKARISIVLLGLLMISTIECGLFDRLKNEIGKLPDRAKDGQNSVKEGLKKLGEEVSKDVSEVEKKVSDSFRKVGDEIAKDSKKAGDTIGNGVNQLEDAAKKIGDAISTAAKLKEIQEVIKKSLDQAKDFKSFSELISSMFKKKDEKDTPVDSTKKEPETQKSPDQRHSASDPSEKGTDLAAEIPSGPQDPPKEDVDAFNQNRGEYYMITEKFGDIIQKFSDPEIRNQFLSGLLSSTEITSKDPECIALLNNVSSAIPVLIQSFTKLPNEKNNGMLSTLNYLVKFERYFRELKKDGPVKRCFKISAEDIQILLVKVFVFGEEYYENSKSNLDVWTNFANTAFMFQLGMYKSSGESLSDTIKAGLKTTVSVSDEDLSKINLTKCMMTVFKVRSTQDVIIAETPMKSWMRAVDSAKEKCKNMISGTK